MRDAFFHIAPQRKSFLILPTVRTECLQCLTPKQNCRIVYSSSGLYDHGGKGNHGGKRRCYDDIFGTILHVKKIKEFQEKRSFTELNKMSTMYSLESILIFRIICLGFCSLKKCQGIRNLFIMVIVYRQYCFVSKLVWVFLQLICLQQKLLLFSILK